MTLAEALNCLRLLHTELHAGMYSREIEALDFACAIMEALMS